MTHTLDELDVLPDLDDDLEPYDVDDQDDDDLDDDPAPAARRASPPQRTRRRSRNDRAATRDALCELVRDALGAKIGHDVNRLAIALDHLDTIAANLDTLRAAIAAEQTTGTQQDTQP